MNTQLVEAIKKIKADYKKEGFIILGVFGSYARGDENENSDIDILYETTEEFREKYAGFNYFEKISLAQEELTRYFKMNVDIADKSCLVEIGKKYILPEVIYVA